jgi:uncharacterized protein (DUF2461 family)
MTFTIDNPRTFRIDRSLRIAHVTAPKERWFVQFLSSRGKEWEITGAFTRIGHAMRSIEGILRDDPSKLERAREWIVE